MKRDMIQGFIDAYLLMGGEKDELKNALDAWMKDHPTYPQDANSRAVILDDLDSYRGVKES